MALGVRQIGGLGPLVMGEPQIPPAAGLQEAQWEKGDLTS